VREDPKRLALTAECRILTRALIGVEPSPPVLNAYQRAHELGVAELAAVQRSPTDRALMRVALGGPSLARAADGYAAMFARRSLLRRKLVLLVAILESRRVTADALETARRGSRAAWLARMMVRAAACGVRLVAVSFLVLPLRLWYGLADRPTT
jgi:hypothetical protein